VATFEEFRASFPEGNNEKGERFELVLADWFLKEHPLFKNRFKRIWRYLEWSGAWHSKDLGTDLIAEDFDGKICAIQAKFYAQTTTVEKGAVDSFLSDSARTNIDYRLLIATTDKVNLNATITIEGQEKPIQLFLLHDFLESDLKWPASYKELIPLAPKPKKPRPHQRKAINDVVKNLSGRGQLIMACGTGKTLTGQRIAERLEAQTTLVLFPSLLLLSNTVREWLRDQQEGFSFLAVCSDSTVTSGQDSAEISTSELSYPPTTDPGEIAKFLKKPGRKVVFSTYQSSPQIATAMKQHNLPAVDLILADEAHRCAGKTDSGYATVLDNELIPAKQRLFMTATPRVYKTHVKKKAVDNDIDLASMDDEAVFGPVLHKLSFGEAIELKQLSDYRVVVVGVNDAMVQEMVEDRTLVKTETGVEDDARSLATQIGLAKAIKQYDLKRVISFHSRINLAKNYARDFSQTLAWLRKKERPNGKLTYEYVSGAMSTSERTVKLNALGNLQDQDRYILANARCLSEGVDVPNLDGVAFIDPKRSEIDIVQAVGRAIRVDKNNESKIGTIVIPVFIEEGDDADEKLRTSEFDQVWKVLIALRSHDEAFGDELDQLRVKLGRRQKISILGDKINFDIHHSIDQSFIEAFETRLVEATTATWMFWYGLLKTYRETYSDVLVPTHYKTHDGFALGYWVANQRPKKDEMPAERIKRLNDLGFVWDSHASTWEAACTELAEYKKAHGNVLVSGTYKTPDGFALGRWVHNQRTAKNKLPAERIKRLDDLGFVWEVYTAEWEFGYIAFTEYKETHSNVLVSSAFKTPDGFALGRWVSTQRKNKNKMPAERLKRLDDLGFVWDSRSNAAWQTGYTALAKYKITHGDVLVPTTYRTSDGFALGGWVTKQRRAKNKMPAERIKRLNDLGFVWDPLNVAWEAGYTALAEYKEMHGDVLVPQNHKTPNGFNVGAWIGTQRKTKDKMSAERLKRLDDLGFVWDPLNVAWEAGYKALAQYKKTQGDVLVAAKHKTPDGFALGNWVVAQRIRKDKLTTERLKKLNDLSFVWRVR